MSKSRKEPFADRLRRLREAADLSVLALAEKAKLSKQAVHRIEAGQQYPTVPVLAKIASALGVGLGAFDGASYPKRKSRLKSE